VNNIHKLQKPSCSKIHKHFQIDNHEHNCDCAHNHSHEELYGQLKEVPAIFSYSDSFQFDKEVTGYEVKNSLVDWIESLRQWALQNKYFIGHIKIFAENRKKFNIWISTTGKKINIKASDNEGNSKLESITINMTVIVFGIDEQTLKLVTLENLNKKFLHCKKHER
jgi:hypothetical protein